jgi:serine/threonine-protein kinase RsbW
MHHRAALVSVLTRTWQQAFPGTPDQLGRVRAALRTFMDDCPATDDAVLLVSEVCANAIAHSASGGPGGTFTVRVQHIHGERVEAEVRDAGSDWDGDIARSACHVHGLYLLLAIASTCGTSGRGSSRTVWFRLDDPAARELP